VRWSRVDCIPRTGCSLSAAAQETCVACDGHHHAVAVTAALSSKVKFLSSGSLSQGVVLEFGVEHFSRSPN
jgi:hypothetical protein